MNATTLRPPLLIAALLLMQPAPATAHAETTRATITGGVQADGAYAWTVKNQHTVPIVYVEFPHYHGDLFMTPAAWKQETTYLVNVGVPDRAGVCTASVDNPARGIAPGRTAEFGLRISADGTRHGRGNARVRFADGTEVVISDVPLPVQPPTIEKYTGLVGVALLAALIVVLEARRRRRARRASPQAPPAGAD